MTKKFIKNIVERIKNIYHALYVEIKSRLRYFPSFIKWFFQRGLKGYSTYDVWNFDNYLAGIIVGGLKELKKTKYDLPGEFCKYKNDKNLEKEDKDWEKVLDKMISSFLTAKKIIDNKLLYIPESSSREKRELKKLGFNVMTKKEELKYEEGWNLFKKHFFSLWD